MAAVAQKPSTQVQIGPAVAGGFYSHVRFQSAAERSERAFDLQRRSDSDDVRARAHAHASRYYAHTLQAWHAQRVCRACNNSYTIASALGRWQCRRHLHTHDRSCCRHLARPAHVSSVQWTRGCVRVDHDDGSVYGGAYVCIAVSVPAVLLATLTEQPHRMETQPLHALISSSADADFVGNVIADDMSVMRFNDDMFTVYTAEAEL